MSRFLRAMCFFVGVDRLPERVRKMTDVSRLLPDQQLSFQASMLDRKSACHPRARASKRRRGRRRDKDTFDRPGALHLPGHIEIGQRLRRFG